MRPRTSEPRDGPACAHLIGIPVESSGSTREIGESQDRHQRPRLPRRPLRRQRRMCSTNARSAGDALRRCG